MKSYRPWFALIIALAIITSSHLSAVAQMPKPTLVITPATLKLAPGEPTAGLVTLTNPLTTTLQGLTLTWFSDAGVNVTIQPPLSNTLAPQATTAWTMSVVKQANSIAAGALYLRLDYTTTLASQSLATILTSEIEIQERPPDPVEKIVQARVESALETVQEQRAGLVYLIVSNSASVPITLTEVVVNKPEFVTMTAPAKIQAPLRLAPQEAVALEYTFASADRVQAGKHTLVFVTNVTWERGAQPMHATLTTPYKFTVGVLGESEILTALGVPSFLLLPGFLLVVAFRFLQTRVHPKSASPLELKSPEFWLIAILLSGLAAPVYTWLTARDYLSAYGLRDIVLVWSGSVFLGALAWSVWYGGKRCIRSVWLRNVPTENDDELQTIQKLAGRKMGFALEQAQIKISGQTQRVFILEPERASRTKVWVAPGIVYRVAPDAPAPIVEAFTHALDQVEDASTMAFVMRQASNAGAITFSWDAPGVLASPTEIEKSVIIERLGKRRILIEAE